MTQDLLRRTNLIGAIVALAFLASAILVFASRLLGKPQIGRGIGYLEFVLALPLLYLVWQGPVLERPPLYYIQIASLLAWLIVEAVLDYVLKLDFRHTSWIVITYVMLFFAGSGGMLGIAAQAGRGWGLAAIVLFIAMAVLSFIQRAVTGM